MSVSDEISGLRTHPGFDRCFRIYRNALIDWNASGAIQAAAATLGMDRRAYADGRLRASQFSWVASDDTGPLTRAHVELAYQDAVDEVSWATDGDRRTQT